MNVYISADIEGIGGVVRSEHSSPAGREYALARKLMTAEVNAAALGAFDAGAGTVVVADSHNVGLNLIHEDLDPRVELVMGAPRPLSMMEGIADGFDTVFFVGYHARSGARDANIVHVFTGRVAELRFNNLSVGEIGLNALLAGHFGVPVSMVTGDDQACAEARALLGPRSRIETVEVKKGIGMYAARCLHPERCQKMIREAAKRAVQKAKTLAPFTLDAGPVDLEVRFTTSSAADRAERLPRIHRVDGVTVRYPADDVIEAFKAFNTMCDLVELVPFI